MANIKGGRIRIKKRPNSLYKTVTVIENDPKNSVAEVEVSIAAQHGITPTPSSITLKPRATRQNGNTRYIHRKLALKGGEPNGKPFSLVATMKDRRGATIGSPEKITVTAQDDNGFDIARLALTANKDGETLTLQAAVRGEKQTLVSAIQVALKPADGGSEAEPEEFTLSWVKDATRRRIFNNPAVTFVDSGNVIDMEYSATLTLIDAKGNALSQGEFLITATDDSELANSGNTDNQALTAGFGKGTKKFTREASAKPELQ